MPLATTEIGTDGWISSLMEASTIAKRLPLSSLRYSTRESSTPALPTMARPGSSTSE